MNSSETEKKTYSKESPITLVTNFYKKTLDINAVHSALFLLETTNDTFFSLKLAEDKDKHGLRSPNTITYYTKDYNDEDFSPITSNKKEYAPVSKVCPMFWDQFGYLGVKYEYFIALSKMPFEPYDYIDLFRYKYSNVPLTLDMYKDHLFNAGSVIHDITEREYMEGLIIEDTLGQGIFDASADSDAKINIIEQWKLFLRCEAVELAGIALATIILKGYPPDLLCLFDGYLDDIECPTDFNTVDYLPNIFDTYNSILSATYELCNNKSFGQYEGYNVFDIVLAKTAKKALVNESKEPGYLKRASGEILAKYDEQYRVVLALSIEFLVVPLELTEEAYPDEELNYLIGLGLVTKGYSEYEISAKELLAAIASDRSTIKLVFNRDPVDGGGLVDWTVLDRFGKYLRDEYELPSEGEMVEDLGLVQNSKRIYYNDDVIRANKRLSR